MQKSLTAKQRSLLYGLCNKSLGKSFTDLLEITTEEIQFLTTNELIKEVTEEGRFLITNKGVSSIDTMHTVVHSMGQSYKSAFNTIEGSAAIKMAQSLIDEGFFKRIDNSTTRSKLVTELVSNGYLKEIRSNLSKEILECLIFQNTTRIPVDIIIESNSIFKEVLKQKIINVINASYNRDECTETHKDFVLYNIKGYGIEELIGVLTSVP
jgi:hypothetical protein